MTKIERTGRLAALDADVVLDAFDLQEIIDHIEAEGLKKFAAMLRRAADRERRVFLHVLYSDLTAGRINDAIATVTREITTRPRLHMFDRFAEAKRNRDPITKRPTVV